MSYKLIITREAQIDLDEIFVWYEEQKTGLGFRFMGEFENVLQKISLNPYFASLLMPDVRQATTKRFPYSVIYRINEKKAELRIIVVTHQSRRPGWFISRM